MKLYNGAPVYFGGKRKLVKKIISLSYKLCHNTEVFVDAFSGSSIVGLAAKLQNWQVLSNDYQFHAYTTAKALIENHNQKLSEYDILKIYNHVEYDKTENYLPELYNKLYKYIPIKQHLKFLVSTSYLNNKLGIFKNEYKKHLINLLIIRYINSILPYCNIESTDPYKVFVEDKNLNPKTVKIIAKELKLSYNVAKKCVNKINNSLFNNNKNNIVFNDDVLVFFDKIKDLINNDKTIVYLDPPYYGSVPYEVEYSLLNDLLFAEKKTKSVYNQKEWEEFFLKLLTKFSNYYIISYAGEYIENMVKLVKQVKHKVDVLEYDYIWTIGEKDNKKIKTKEYLIYGV